MTLPAPSTSAGLPVTNSAFEPAWVRKGSQRVKDEYRAAQAFEMLLVEQLASTLSETGGGEGAEAGQEGSSSSPGSGAPSALLPQALARGVIAGGGLGLAAGLTRELEGHERAASDAGASAPAGSAPNPAAGGSAAPAAAGGPAGGGTSA